MRNYELSAKKIYVNDFCQHLHTDSEPAGAAGQWPSRSAGPLAAGELYPERRPQSGHQPGREQVDGEINNTTPILYSMVKSESCSVCTQCKQIE